MLASKMRSYDLLMRYGDGEFVCVLAELVPSDTVATPVERADHDTYRSAA